MIQPLQNFAPHESVRVFKDFIDEKFFKFSDIENYAQHLQHFCLYHACISSFCAQNSFKQSNKSKGVMH